VFYVSSFLSLLRSDSQIFLFCIVLIVTYLLISEYVYVYILSNYRCRPSMQCLTDGKLFGSVNLALSMVWVTALDCEFCVAGAPIYDLQTVADAQGVGAASPLLAQGLLNRFFPYKGHIVRCVHLR